MHSVSSTNKVMRQMVPMTPIAWGGGGNNGPLTLVGMREWQDINITTSFQLPSNSTGLTAGCVGTRSDQVGDNGIFFCVYTAGNWSLSTSHAEFATGVPVASNIISTGKLPGSGVTRGSWHTLSLTTVDGSATAMFDQQVVAKNQAVRNIDTGFAILGANSWVAIEFDWVSVTAAGPRWNPPQSPCATPQPGSPLYTRNCSTNGLPVADEVFDLVPDWTLRHVASGLCAQASADSNDATVSLAMCDATNPLQQFKNDYTNIRNRMMPVYLDEDSGKTLTGVGNSAVGINQKDAAWNSWTYFPNTKQLRNQYTANTKLGYPQCLSVCKP